ncbi:MAG: hypothetical protein KDI51_11540 [Xanthomonadales bacterium]|nr:hypothetical protein [Xanthomonadales bacterium]MCB1787443.1 hypothetical protein [Gammaproteobacteria bacterium]
MSDLASKTVVCLDSAHWGDLLAALASSRTRTNARGRLTAFATRGGVLALSMHHVAEMAQHENAKKARTRFQALSELRSLRVVSPMTGEGLGSIVDLLALELKVVVESPGVDAVSVANAVRPDVLVTATGLQVSNWILPMLDELRAYVMADAPRRRAISALSQSVALDRSRDLLGTEISVVPPHQAKANLAALEKRLTTELVSRRDPRASETEARETAFRFVRDLMSDVDAVAEHGSYWGKLFEGTGVSPHEVAEMRCYGEVADLVLFRKQLEIPAEHLGYTAAQLRCIRPEQFPTWLLHHAFKTHRQLAARTRASDLTDIQLLSFAPYMDALFVDKRTHESVRRVRQKDPTAAAFLRSTMRASSWERALSLALGPSLDGKT